MDPDGSQQGGSSTHGGRSAGRGHAAGQGDGQGDGAGGRLMFADAVQLLAVVLAAGWLGLLMPVARGRAGGTGRRAGTALVLATGTAVAAFGLQAALAEGIDDAGGGATRLDAAAAAVAVGHRTPALTALAATLDAAAGLAGLAVLAAAAAAVLLRHGRRVEAALVVAAPAVAGLLGEAAKLGYDRDRPPVSGHLVTVDGSSLPSGHTLDATIVLGVLAVVAVSLVRGRPARVAVVAAAGTGIAVAGAARVYLGVHWATDALAGWLLGTAWVALAAAALLLLRGGRAFPVHRPASRAGPRWRGTRGASCGVRCAGVPRRSRWYCTARSGTTQPAQVEMPAAVQDSSIASPWKVVSSGGTSNPSAATAHSRLVMIDIVSTTLRTVQRRCSRWRRRRAIRKPVIVHDSQTAARRTLLTRATGPNGLSAPMGSAVRAAGTTPPKT